MRRALLGKRIRIHLPVARSRRAIRRKSVGFSSAVFGHSTVLPARSRISPKAPHRSLFARQEPLARNTDRRSKWLPAHHLQHFHRCHPRLSILIISILIPIPIVIFITRSTSPTFSPSTSLHPHRQSRFNFLYNQNSSSQSPLIPGLDLDKYFLILSAFF